MKLSIFMFVYWSFEYLFCGEIPVSYFSSLKIPAFSDWFIKYMFYKSLFRYVYWKHLLLCGRSSYSLNSNFWWTEFYILMESNLSTFLFVPDATSLLFKNLSQLQSHKDILLCNFL